MKSTIIFGVTAFVVFITALAAAQKEQNIGTILNNQYVLNGYIKCVLDQGKCNKMGEDLKRESIFRHYRWMDVAIIADHVCFAQSKL